MSEPTVPIDEGPRTGVPLVLLHGFLGCAADWQPLIGPLASTRRCVAFDLPGHGPRPEVLEAGANTFDAVVEALWRRLDALDIGRCDLLGYSLGGRLAFGLLCARPEGVRRAIVLGGSVGIDDEAARRAREQADEARARALAREPFPAWLDAWYAQPLFAALARAPAYPAMRARRLAGRPAALAGALRALSPGRQPPLGPRLKGTAVPLLLVAGALDRKYVDQNRVLAAQRPHTRAVVVADAGHAPHLEKPDVFLSAVREFLEPD